MKAVEADFLQLLFLFFRAGGRGLLVFGTSDNGRVRYVRGAKAVTGAVDRHGFLALTDYMNANYRKTRKPGLAGIGANETKWRERPG